MARYTEERLREVVASNLSMAGVMRDLGIRPAGGSQSHLTRRLKELQISTAHFKRQATNSGPSHKGGMPRRTPDSVLIKRANGGRERSVVLRRALIESGVAYACIDCGNTGSWQGRQLILQVDHLNRDWLDDRKENLTFRCPNCHSQTPGWCGGKGQSLPIKHRNQEVWRQANPVVPMSERNLSRPEKGNWPSDDKLRELVQIRSLLSLAKEIGVSDNAIRHRCKKRGIQLRGRWTR